MSLKCGIIGMPNVGKSTLFNALLKKRVALSANYPFATVEPNIGVVGVSDPRLEVLSELVKKEEGMDKAPPIIPAVVEFVDIAGLVKGAHQGAGLGNQFLSHIREVDAILHVLRNFEDANIVRGGSTDPKSDREIVETELALADLQTVDKLLTAFGKQDIGSDPFAKQKIEILSKIKDDLEQGRTLTKAQVDPKLNDWFSQLPLLTIKPVLYVYNISEDNIKPNTHESIHENSSNMIICAKLEEELVDLSEDERLEYLKQMGIEETGLERLIKKAYWLLGLISFLTAGPKEIRAWTIREGTKAHQAAGEIHTDFEKNFIRASVIEYQKLIEAGSYANAKLKGWIRTEGKEYLVQDGDVIEFLVGN